MQQTQSKASQGQEGEAARFCEALARQVRDARRWFTCAVALRPVLFTGCEFPMVSMVLPWRERREWQQRVEEEEADWGEEAERAES